MADIKIKYDTPFEVNEKQYNALKTEMEGVVAHRKDEQGRFWIKVWLMKYVKEVKQILKKYE